MEVVYLCISMWKCRINVLQPDVRGQETDGQHKHCCFVDYSNAVGREAMSRVFISVFISRKTLLSTLKCKFICQCDTPPCQTSWNEFMKSTTLYRPIRKVVNCANCFSLVYIELVLLTRFIQLCCCVGAEWLSRWLSWGELSSWLFCSFIRGSLCLSFGEVASKRIHNDIWNGEKTWRSIECVHYNEYVLKSWPKLCFAFIFKESG